MRPESFCCPLGNELPQTSLTARGPNTATLREYVTVPQGLGGFQELADAASVKPGVWRAHVANHMGQGVAVTAEASLALTCAVSDPPSPLATQPHILPVENGMIFPGLSSIQVWMTRE